MSFHKKSDTLIIIPAYNEEDNILKVVELSKKYADVCVVNDNSSDRTYEILKTINNIKIINHKYTTHIPGATLDGLIFANHENYDYAITMDAGLSHDPNEIPLFMNFEHCDLLIGVRQKIVEKPIYRYFLTKVGNLIYNISLNFPFSILKLNKYKDLTSGFRRFSKKSIQLISKKKINSKSYDMHLETVFQIYKNKYHIQEVFISYYYSSSSINFKTVLDCIIFSLKVMFKLEK